MTSQTRPSRRSLFAWAAAAALLAGLPAGGPAQADAAANPLPKFLEGLQVGPGIEFRFVVLHGVYGPPQEAPASPPLVHAVPKDALGVDPASHTGRASARVTNFSKEPAWAVPGDVIRLSDGDYAVRSDTFIPGGAETAIPVFRVAVAPNDEKPREEPRWCGTLPGPGLLYELLNAQREKSVAAPCAELAKESALATPRKSPVELKVAEKIAARAKQYRARLSVVPRPAGAQRRELTGYAVVLDGAWAGFETFSDAGRFASVWSDRLDGICVEAALMELANGTIQTDLADPADPDRHLAAVKDAILPLYGLDPESRKVAGLGTILPLEKGDDRGRAVLDPAGAPQHVFWLRDPTKRRVGPDPEGPDLDPGVIDRKMRPTEFEKRWKERRGGAGE
jgi:hypothetical protein